MSLLRILKQPTMLYQNALCQILINNDFLISQIYDH